MTRERAATLSRPSICTLKGVPVELFSPGHLIVLLVIVGILFFGWKQLPDMAQSAGRSLRVFRTEIKGMNDDVKAATTADAPSPRPATPLVAPVPTTPTQVAVDSTISPTPVTLVVPTGGISDQDGRPQSST
jgi:sec-independent protein translocase protein TatA